MIQRDASHSAGTGTNARYGTSGSGLMTWYVMPPTVTVSSDPGGRPDDRLPFAMFVAIVMARSTLVTAVAQADRQRRRDVDRRHDQQPGEPGSVEPGRAGARCRGGRRDVSLGCRFGRARRHDRIRAAAVLLGRRRGPQASIRSQDSGVPRSIACAARRPSTSS